ncbi:hypothetical protein [Bacteroides graminisolvens]|uniref:hypothetical protein n=1 Tax=Bacteroides graminisolvens TaxID=477666 RepID=UPI0012B55363|nr:hypothetical protein [Bacteroides graminisolvens]
MKTDSPNEKKEQNHKKVPERKNGKYGEPEATKQTTNGTPQNKCATQRSIKRRQISPGAQGQTVRNKIQRNQTPD